MPNYDSCKKMFIEALKMNGWKNDGKLDFSSPVAKATPKKVLIFVLDYLRELDVQDKIS